VGASDRFARTPSDPLRPVFFPATLFHDHANQDANGLSQAGAAPHMDRTEERIDLRNRLQLAYNSGERRAGVVNFRFFHSALAVGIVKKVQHLSKGLLGIIHDVHKGFSLWVI
jgi:hypothetical protein